MTSSPQPGPDQARMKWLAIVVVAIFVLVLGGLFVVRLGAEETGDPAKVQAALKGTASTLLAGTGEPAALAAATCEFDTADEYLCTPQGLKSSQAIRFVLADDGTLTERLSGTKADTNLRSGDAMATALAFDAGARGLGTPEYACGTSIRMSPDGATEQGSAAGFLCVAKTAASGTELGKASGARYVEATPAGTLSRDYAIRTK